MVGTSFQPKLGLQPKPFGEACYASWQGVDFTKNNEPQGNQPLCQVWACFPLGDNFVPTNFMSGSSLNLCGSGLKLCPRLMFTKLEFVSHQPAGQPERDK